MVFLSTRDKAAKSGMKLRLPIHSSRLHLNRVRDVLCRMWRGISSQRRGILYLAIVHVLFLLQYRLTPVEQGFMPPLDL